MKVWLDDDDEYRPTPPGWVRAHSVNEAKRFLLDDPTQVTHMSLDNDLGIYSDDGGEGFRLVAWMAENDTWPTAGIEVHSSNTVRVEWMLGVIDRHGPYPQGWGTRRGSW